MSISTPCPEADDLAAWLVSGGDSRLALDPATGLNRYFCPPRPTSRLACFASCTASPISPEGWRAAGEALDRLRTSFPPLARDPLLARDALNTEAATTAAALGSALGIEDIANIFLTPSGTDATMLVTGLLTAERRDEPLVNVMAAATETGEGVPLAAAGRHFSDIAAGAGRVQPGERLRGLPAGTQTIHVALRRDDGTARERDEIDADFAAAAASAPARPVVHLIEASKTGLHAPHVLPRGADVVVDACQGRVSPSRLRDHLLRGWPVLITGSKFYGGPAFCGAVLFPAARLASIDLARLPSGLAAYGHEAGSIQPAVNAGTALRWAAALEEIRAFVAEGLAELLAHMRRLAVRVSAWIASTPSLVPISMPAGEQDGPREWPHDILTFAVRDPHAPGRLLGLPELRSLYRDIASDGVLVGQPVGVGATFGGLRIAIGASTLRDPLIEPRLQRLFSCIERRTRLR